MRLKYKFLLPTICLILAGMSITSWIIYDKSTNSLSKLAIEKADSSLFTINSLVDVWVSGIQNELITLSKIDVSKTTFSEAEVSKETYAKVESLFLDVLKRYPYCDNIELLNTNGVVIAGSNPKLTGKDLHTRVYFQEAVSGKNYISNPIISSVDGQPVFVLSAPVRNNDSVVGVVTIGVRIANFTEKFILPLSNPASYAFIVAPDGLLLAHPNQEYVGKFNFFEKVAGGKQLAEKESGLLETTTDGTDKQILYMRSQSSNWILAIAIIKKEAYAASRTIGYSIIGLSLAQVVLLVVGILIILSINVLKPIASLVTSATSIAQGQMDYPLKVDRKDELGILQQSFVTMVENLKAKIQEAQHQEHLAAQETQKAREAMEAAEEAHKNAESAQQKGINMAANRLESIVSEVTSAVREISSQVDKSNNATQEQSRLVAETATAMEEMNSTVLEVANNAAQAASIADNTRGKADDGSDIVSNSIQSIGIVQKKAEELRDDMAELGKQAESIGQIMNVISDIADQTNLLALNAAIEAARAGEAGRGFAVVADEVRKLAEKTMSATKEVGDAISGIQKGTQKNISNMEQATTSIDEATALAQSSGEALSTILGFAEETSDQVRTIATAAEEQSATAEEINRSISTINELAGESSEALSHSVEAVERLSEQARILRSIIDEMKSGK